jgi:hypothetical protein
MQLITRETAEEYRKKGLESRFAIKNREIDELKRKLAEALGPKTEDDLRRRERLLKQVQKCDDMMDDCEDSKEFAMLVTAKARLWELLYPKPGSLRPRSKRDERQPIAPLVALGPPQPAPTTPQANPVTDNET